MRFGEWDGWEVAPFLPYLSFFLQTRFAGKMPKIATHPCDGSIPSHEKLKHVVQNVLSGKDAVEQLSHNGFFSPFEL